MNTRACQAKKAAQKTQRLKSSLAATASRAKKAKTGDDDAFDVGQFLKSAESDDRKQGRDLTTKNGNTHSYTKAQVSVERRFVDDLAANYGEFFLFLVSLLLFCF